MIIQQVCVMTCVGCNCAHMVPGADSASGMWQALVQKRDKSQDQVELYVKSQEEWIAHTLLEAARHVLSLLRTVS